MRQIKAPLSLGQTGDEVVYLQSLLMELIAGKAFILSEPAIINRLAEEQGKQFFGTATAAVVDDYLDSIGAETPPESEPQVNDHIARAIEDSWNSLQANRNVVIHGSVKHLTGLPLTQGYLVQLFALNYKTEVALKNMTTNIDGSFSFTLTAAEREGLSGSYLLRVKATDESGMLTEYKIFQESTDIAIDLVIDDDTVTVEAEYPAVVAALQVVIGTENISDIDTDNADELQYLSKMTGEEVQTITKMAQAHKLKMQMSTSTDIAPQLYALLRQNIAPNATVLMNLPFEAVVKLLENAVNSKIIDEPVSETKEVFAAKLPSRSATLFVADLQVQDPENSKTYSIVHNILGDQEKSKDFLRLSIAYNLEDGEDFWSYLDSQSEALNSADITRLSHGLTISSLTVNNQAVTNALFTIFDEQSEAFPSWATSLPVSELETIIKAEANDDPSFYPDFIKEAADKDKAYAEYLFSTIRQTYPSIALKSSIEQKNSQWVGLPKLKASYSSFIERNSDFNFRAASVYALDSHHLNLTEIEEPERFIEELAIAQRLLNVTDDHDLIAAMAHNGLHSSIQIARLSETAFLNDYPDNTASARNAYAAAVGNAAFSYMMALDQFTSLTAPKAQVFNNVFTGDNLSTATDQAYAEWRSLFGSLIVATVAIASLFIALLLISPICCNS